MGDTFTPAELRAVADRIEYEQPSAASMLRYAADVLEKLPVTADGVRVHGQTLYHPGLGAVRFNGVERQLAGDGWVWCYSASDRRETIPKWCYSTREAALAARQDGGEG
jgi:hypothetical protein